MGLQKAISLLFGMALTFLGVTKVKNVPHIQVPGLEDVRSDERAQNHRNLEDEGRNEVEEVSGNSALKDSTNSINRDAADFATIFNESGYDTYEFSNGRKESDLIDHNAEVTYWRKRTIPSSVYEDNYPTLNPRNSRIGTRNGEIQDSSNAALSAKIFQGGSDLMHKNEINDENTDFTTKIDVAEIHRSLSDVALMYTKEVAEVDDHMTPKFSMLSVKSFAKLSLVAMFCIFGAFLNVSPREATPEVYYELFKRNLLLLITTLIGPALVLMTLHDPRRLSADSVVSVFFSGFTWGYICTFLLEIVMATLYRLIVLGWMEPVSFGLCPDVPVIYLPWVLKDYGYSLKPLTSFVADLAVYCFGAPVIEEVMKVTIARRSGLLPTRKNVVQSKPAHVHTYVVLIVAASMGMKVADNARRVLLYNRNHHSQKFIFALLRGFFPLQDICAALTAMNLAKKEVLGQRMSPIRVFFPAFFIHALANFRGGKPIFKWKSDAPWIELQMGSFRIPSGTSVRDIVHRCALSLAWCALSLALLSYTIRAYWSVSSRRHHHSTLHSY